MRTDTSNFKIFSNMGQLLVCIFLVISPGCAATQGQYIDDSIVTAKIKTAIYDEPSLKVLKINVETTKGDVRLHGFVDSEQSAKKAGEVAGRIMGVGLVTNNLVVR